MRRNWVKTGLITMCLLLWPLAIAASAQGKTVWDTLLQPAYGLGFGWDRGLVYESRDKSLKIKAGGWFQYELAGISPSSSIDAAYPDMQGLQSGFRRIRVFVNAYYRDWLEGRVMYDLTGDSKDRVDLWLGTRGYPFGGYIRAGWQKEPLSLEAIASSRNSLLMERSLAHALAPGRNNGLRVQMPLLDRRMTFSAGLYNSAIDFQNALTSWGEWDFTVRLTGLPWYGREDKPFLHVGLALSHQSKVGGGGIVRYRTRPEVYLTGENILDSGDIRADTAEVMALEAALAWGRWHIQAEIMNSWVDAPGSGSYYWFPGFYVSCAYSLTGEQRAYNPVLGIFGGIIPEKPFRPDKQSWGAWEVTGRVSFLDLNDNEVSGGRELNLSAGLNWVWGPRVKVMLNYVYASIWGQPEMPSDEGSLHAVQTRFRIGF